MISIIDIQHIYSRYP